MADEPEDDWIDRQCSTLEEWARPLWRALMKGEITRAEFDCKWDYSKPFPALEVRADA